MYNALEFSRKTESIVVDGMRKKYYRFRPTRFYGGIATADTVGCNLRCVFCWSESSVWRAHSTGVLCSPEEVAEKLERIAIKKGYHQVRVSGGEPTIGKQHLITLLTLLDEKFLFILETNGILLGSDEAYVKELASFKNLHVRVCLKGCNEDEFSWFTGADKTGFQYQLKALSFLQQHQISFHIALVTLPKSQGKLELYNRLQDMNLGRVMLEEETIMLYPRVKKRLLKKDMLKYFE